jgi:hypothetical protein
MSVYPFLIVKRRFDPLRKRYRGIEKTSCMLNVCLALANLTHMHLLPAGCTSRLPESLDLSWSLLPDAVPWGRTDVRIAAPARAG